MLSFAIGDVHGCIVKLLDLLGQCRRYADGRPAKFIFLGDYIDRGPDSRGVVQAIMNLQQDGPEQVIALCGNHEDLLHRTHSHDGLAHWLNNGGDATLRSYAITSPKDMLTEHRDWLQTLPTFHDDGQRFFVHAGIRPGIPLYQQSRSDLLWIREPFLSSATDHGRLIVHGHTPLRDGKPGIRSNRINLDTGAVFGRPLTGAVFDETQRMPVEILQSFTFNLQRETRKSLEPFQIGSFEWPDFGNQRLTNYLTLAQEHGIDVTLGLELEGDLAGSGGRRC